jgi:hypothetical protein
MLDNLLIGIINLEHRQDRRDECLVELSKADLKSEGAFFKAKYIKDSGARACALSHAMLLSEFMFHDDKPFALILEDDFVFRDPAGFKGLVSKVLEAESAWDVFLLGHNLAVPIESHQHDFLRVINSQTASGYLVGRLYASKLIELFFRSSELQSRYMNLPSPNKEIAKHHFALDILWKEMQIKDRFLTTFPSAIYQRVSFSDIEAKVVDYGGV